jgi:RNA polymerase sigma-70 factor (ECF subfamily)
VAASDEALVAEYVDGNSDAFDELVRRHSRRVYGICLRYFGNAADAEDAAQETFVAVLRRATTFNGASAFSTWLYRVATNACNDIARKRARRPRNAGTDVAQLVDLADPHDLLANRELRLELRTALQSLEPEHRDAVVLHDVGGLAYVDIAGRLGVPVGTVKSRIHRGHARLALALTHLREASGDPAAEPSGAAAPPTVQP